jgi:hypothetical protein
VQKNLITEAAGKGFGYRVHSILIQELHQQFAFLLLI